MEENSREHWKSPLPSLRGLPDFRSGLANVVYNLDKILYTDSHRNLGKSHTIYYRFRRYMFLLEAIGMGFSESDFNPRNLPESYPVKLLTKHVSNKNISLKILQLLNKGKGD